MFMGNYHGVVDTMMAAKEDTESALHASCVKVRAAGTQLLTRAQAVKRSDTTWRFSMPRGEFYGHNRYINHKKDRREDSPVFCYSCSTNKKFQFFIV
ncbi:SbtR family transcriptional regulator [Salibacterium aidingense]|uniref:SbtR family transcriptional regulator n=1 Tax=Salibacterium aidingense TaxID=384933 RepID=UPI003BD51F02